MSFTARLPGGDLFMGGWSAEPVDQGVVRRRRSEHVPLLRSERARAFRSATTSSSSGRTASRSTCSWARRFRATPAASYRHWAVPVTALSGRAALRRSPCLSFRPEAEYLDRWTQVDLAVRKMVAIGRVRVNGGVDLFNLLNTNVVLQENQNFGASLEQPQAILQGRLLRISAQVTF